MDSLDRLPMPDSVSQGRRAAVELTGVTRHFGERNVLRGIDLSIDEGSFLAIVGQSGCGKSTLLRLVAGLDEPSAGSMRLDGDENAGLKRSVRVMFQDARLLPWRRVIENVSIGLPENHDAPVREILRRVGLVDRADDWPAVLSGGQRQRVALARALASRPKVLLLDEPLGSLDALTRLAMQGLIEELWRDRGFTAILVTHDVEEAAYLADRVVVLDRGVISASFDISLPRPRRRASTEYARIVKVILDRVMSGREVPIE